MQPFTRSVRRSESASDMTRQPGEHPYTRTVPVRSGRRKSQSRTARSLDGGFARRSS